MASPLYSPGDLDNTALFVVCCQVVFPNFLSALTVRTALTRPDPDGNTSWRVDWIVCVEKRDHV